MGAPSSVKDEEVAIADIAPQTDIPTPAISPAMRPLERFNDATFAWAGDLGATTTFPALVRETDIFDIPQDRAAS